MTQYALRQVVEVLEQLAPVRLAESWDNVGLLVGDSSLPARRALLAVDYTPAVMQEAEQLECDTVVLYHPPIFEPLKRLTPASAVFRAIRAGRALYSLHTALDVAPGGTNDMLADVLGMTDVRPLRPQPTTSTESRLVTSVPAEAVDRVADALCEAGAGHIGRYSRCTFRTEGVGTFQGDETTHPAMGQAGHLETFPLVRLELRVPNRRLAEVVTALRASHPFEEPAFDLLPVTDPPSGLGMGRLGRLPGVPRAALIERIKEALELPVVQVSGPIDGLVHSAAVGAGACGDLINTALAQRADLYLTGELRHHDALKAAAAGMTVVCTLHSNSERKVLARVKQQLEAGLPGLDVRLSQADRDPFVYR